MPEQTTTPPRRPGRMPGFAPVDQRDLFDASAPPVTTREAATRSIIDELDDTSGSMPTAPEPQSNHFRPGGAPRPPGRRMSGFSTPASDPPPAASAPPAAVVVVAEASPRPATGFGRLRQAARDDDDDGLGAVPAPRAAPAAATPAAPPPRRGLSALTSSQDDEDAFPTPRQADIADVPREEGLVEEKCQVRKLLYQSKPPASDYRVFLVARPDKSTFKLSTNSSSVLGVNERVVARGKWKVYKGEQTLHANYLVPEIPKDAIGIVKWLKSGAVQGVGGRTADRLVEHYGDRLVDVLGDAAALARAGVAPRVAEAIADNYVKNTGQVSLVHFLGGLGLGESGITKIIKRYGMMAKAVIERNPWQLADTIEGVGFQTADGIGLRHGHPRASPDRIKAALRHALRMAVQEGHCGLPPREMVKGAVKLTGLPDGLITIRVEEALDGDRALYDPNTGLAAPRDIRDCEDGIAEHLVRLMRRPGIPAAEAALAIADSERKLGVRLDPSQRTAAVMALVNSVCIITGGPGTGKSTTMRVLVDALKSFGRDPVLAAPTGRAAKRLTEVSGHGASTCHRLLSYSASEGGFSFHADNPFPEDWFVTDEFSMVDTRLAHSFVQAIKDGAGLTIVGDVDQLPSVGPGQVLRDLIESGAVPTARLSTVHRQGKDSGIVTAAHNINTGLHPMGDGTPLNGFEVDSQEDPEALVARIVQLMRVDLPALGYDPIKDVQVLAPTRKRDLGIDVLNLAIKDAMNPALDDGRSVTLSKRTFTVGDRVMHIRNDYSKGVYNGEVGSVCEITTSYDKGERVPSGFVVDYSGDKVNYSSKDVSDVEQAWATTVHKSQGCEFPVVILACHSVHTHMLNRNLVYTAVTRAKERCIVVGEDAMLAFAAKKTDATRRHTGLRKLVVLESERHLPPPEPDDAPFLQLDDGPSP